MRQSTEIHERKTDCAANADIKDKLENYGVYKGNAIRVLAYLLSDGAMEVCEVYIGNRMSTYAHVYHET